MKTRTLYTREEIAAAVQKTAAAVLARFGREEPVTVLALLSGALWFAADLLRELPDNYMLSTVRVSSYGAGTASSGKLRWCTPCPEVVGQRVLIVDDVLDTGLTLRTLTDYLLDHGAAEVATCVAVDKQVQRSLPMEADFAAMTAEDGFLIGYGMDWDEHYRNRPSIEVVEEET